MTWDPEHLPDMTGRTFAVTGATAGIGYFAAEQLAAAGAHVVLASRSAAKLAVAEAAIRGRVPRAALDSVVVDLASLDSVRTAASALAALPALHGVFLNGGAMAFGRALTADGLPLLVGTHAVANVALVEGILDRLVATGRESGKHSRIVHASTGFVRRWNVSVDDLTRPSRVGVLAYTQAKKATEIFAYELDRRLRANGLPVASLVAHPGVGVDARTPQRPGIRDATTPSQRNPFTPWAQGKDAAAWSGVRALTDPGASGGEYFGPAEGMRGLPARITPLARTADPAPGVADAVWAQLERLAGAEIRIGALR
ncbi:SDR family NAD(P)-dependent oxidoreductase [Microbacterium paludicola]|uniref:SDR family NAD(P)-dependent oxidoreductase n=1 Tax=Microbacterium paludicola TaxID=300019 RepID=UPI0038797C19